MVRRDLPYRKGGAAAVQPLEALLRLPLLGGWAMRHLGRARLHAATPERDAARLALQFTAWDAVPTERGAFHCEGGFWPLGQVGVSEATKIYSYILRRYTVWLQYVHHVCDRSVSSATELTTDLRTWGAKRPAPTPRVAPRAWPRGPSPWKDSTTRIVTKGVHDL